MLVRPAKIDDRPSQYSDRRTSWGSGRVAVGTAVEAAGDGGWLPPGATTPQVIRLGQSAAKSQRSQVALAGVAAKSPERIRAARARMSARAASSWLVRPGRCSSGSTTR